MMAMFRSLAFGFYVYSFWIGTEMLYDHRVNVRGGEEYDAGTLLSTLMGLMMGVMVAMGLIPNI
jgi:hypothetical protein